jgi:hypothetical protein
MSPYLWVLMWMFLVHFWPQFWMCTFWKTCWNLNQVQGRSFEIIKDCLKTLFVAPHLSNKLRSLDYQSPICFLSTHHIQQWNHLWITAHSSSNLPF